MHAKYRRRPINLRGSTINRASPHPLGRLFIALPIRILFSAAALTSSAAGSLRPVSYTHLDVYKRQVERYAEAVRERVHMPCHQSLGARDSESFFNKLEKTDNGFDVPPLRFSPQSFVFTKPSTVAIALLTPIQMLTVSANKGFFPSPVSYTHLQYRVAICCRRSSASLFQRLMARGLKQIRQPRIVAENIQPI